MSEEIKRREYRDPPVEQTVIWSQMSWRECTDDILYEYVQNAIDAEAKEIKLRAFKEDGRSILEISDDGWGMYEGECDIDDLYKIDEDNVKIAVGDNRDLRYFVLTGISWKQQVPDALGQFGTGGKTVWLSAVNDEDGRISVLSKEQDHETAELTLDHKTSLKKWDIATESDGLPARETTGTTVSLEGLTSRLSADLSRRGAGKVAMYLAREFKERIVKDDIRISLDIFGDKVDKIEPFEFVKAGVPTIKDTYEDADFGEVEVEIFVHDKTVVNGVGVHVHGRTPVVDVHKEYETVFGDVWSHDYVAGEIKCNGLPMNENRKGLKDQDRVYEFLERVRDKYEADLEQAVEKFERRYQSEMERTMMKQLSREVLSSLDEEVLSKLPEYITGRKKKKSSGGDDDGGDNDKKDPEPREPGTPHDGKTPPGPKRPRRPVRGPGLDIRYFRIGTDRAFRYRDGVVYINSEHEICKSLRHGKNYRRLHDVVKQLAVKCLYEHVYKIPPHVTDGELETLYRMGTLGTPKRSKR